MSARVTIADLLEAKRQRRKIAAVSCYDYSITRLISATDAQMI
ncbi:MAG: hypothetical protein ACYTAO_12700 [Planctomycetota bacterium]|jgi:ketopantoate hydroxymethyltransferase